MAKKTTNNQLEVIKKIPNVSKYENVKVPKRQNWFNKNLAYLVLVLFVLIGIIIPLVIAL